MWTNIQAIEYKIEKLMPCHLGYGNLLSQRDKDQGDTAQRVGTFFTLLAISGYHDKSNHASLQLSYNLLEARPGIFRRSPDPSFWGYNTNNLSRDQLSVLKIGMASNNLTERLKRIAAAQMLRGGFHQNTHPGTDAPINTWKIPDIMAPGELSVYFRSFLGKYSVIPNFFLDALLFVDLYMRKDDNWDVDNMLALNLLFANYKYPTIWSKIAMEMYLKTNFMSRLYNYHRDDRGNGCEPLYWLFRIAFLKQYNYEPTDAP